MSQPCLMPQTSSVCARLFNAAEGAALGAAVTYAFGPYAVSPLTFAAIVGLNAIAGGVLGYEITNALEDRTVSVLNEVTREKGLMVEDTDYDTTSEDTDYDKHSEDMYYDTDTSSEDEEPIFKPDQYVFRASSPNIDNSDDGEEYFDAVSDDFHTSMETDSSKTKKQLSSCEIFLDICEKCSPLRLTPELVKLTFE